MTQPCVYDSIKALKTRFPQLFFDFIDLTPETVYNVYLLNIVDPEMRQYCDINAQIPCSKEILENLLHCFTKKKYTIRYFVCQLIRGAHEKGGIAYKVEEHVLYLSLSPIIHYDDIITLPEEYSMFDGELKLDINEFAFVLRSSRTNNGDIGAGHMMLMKYDTKLVSNLMRGFPENGLK
jgi:hypothetical protein